jgi:hypothetical protein
VPAEQAEHLVFSPGWDTPGFSHGEDVTGRQCTIYNQYIPGVNTSFTHRLPSHPNEKGCCRMLDKVLIEVERAIKVIIGRGRITSRNGNQKQQTSVSCRDIRRSHYVHVHR